VSDADAGVPGPDRQSIVEPDDAEAVTSVATPPSPAEEPADEASKPPTATADRPVSSPAAQPARRSDQGQDWALVDAEAQHAAYPDGFPIPGAEERYGLRAGDMVKLVFVLDPPPPSGPHAERMWVEVALADPDGSYEGWLTNRPVVITSLRHAALIAFEPRHVAGIAPQETDVAFDGAMRAVVSDRALELDRSPGWVGHDEPVSEDDSGWSITAGDEPEDYFETSVEEVTSAMTLGDLARRFPPLAEVFGAGAGEWVYRPEHRRYVRLEGT